MPMRKEIVFKSIGTIHSSFKDTSKIPIQPVFSEGARGYIKIFPEFVEGLADLDGFSHLYLIYHLHKAKEAKLIVRPFLEDEMHGVFATRAPSRPNPIGISIVRLDKIIGNIIHISDLDILDGTPLLDIKPFTSRFDARDNCKEGWLANINEEDAKRRGQRTDN